MEPLRELLAIDHQQTLEFFVVGLQELCDPAVDRQELLYNASVLAASRASLDPVNRRPAHPRHPQPSLRRVRARHQPGSRQHDDGSRRRAVPAAGRLLRRSNAGAPSDRMVRKARRGLLPSRRGARALDEEGETARCDRSPVRAVAAAPLAVEPRTPRSAVPADAALGAAVDHVVSERRTRVIPSRRLY